MRKRHCPVGIDEAEMKCETCPYKRVIIVEMKHNYGEHSEETELLRYLRDNILNQTPEGQELIRLYYEWSPVIVEMIEEDEEFRTQVKEMIDGIAKMIQE